MVWVDSRCDIGIKIIYVHIIYTKEESTQIMDDYSSTD